MKPTIDGADFATITTQCLLVSVDRLYEIAKILTGDNLYTHELPWMTRFAEEYLKIKYPAIAAACENAGDRVILHPDEWRAVAGDLRQMYPAIEVDSPMPGLNRDFDGPIYHLPHENDHGANMNHIYTPAEFALLRAKIRGIIIAGAGVALVAGLAIGAAWFWHDYASELQLQIDEHRCAPQQIRRSMPVPEVRS